MSIRANVNVPEEIQRAAIAAADEAYGAVHGLGIDEGDPIADWIWQETYNGVVKKLMEETA